MKGFSFFPKQRLSAKVQWAPFLQDAKAYNLKLFLKDFYAALNVSLMAIPQALAYALLAHLPLSTGIFSAIFGSMITALMGGSRYLVSGASTGVALLVQTAVLQTHILYPAMDPLQILMQLLLLTALLQVICAFFNVGALLQFVSRAVILGYFLGVALSIVISQLYAFTGLEVPENVSFVPAKILFFLTSLKSINFFDFSIGMVSLLCLLYCMKKPQYPAALVTIVLTSVLAAGFSWGEIHTVTRLDFTYASIQPTFSFIPYFALWSPLFPYASAIAIFSMLEMYSVSRTLSMKTGVNSDVNQDVMGMGLSNLFLSLCTSGALPASASISRSTLNLFSKAQTRFAAVFSGLFIAFLYTKTSFLLRYIPIPTLSAILILSSFLFVNTQQMKMCFRATKEDAMVFILTMMSCLVLSLDTAFYFGIGLSIATFLRKTSHPYFVEYGFTPSGRLTIIDPKLYTKRKIRILGIGGEMFFGVVDTLQKELFQLAEDPHVEAIILRMHGVYHFDASSCFAILRLHEKLKKQKRHLIISGLIPEVWRVLERSSLMEKIGKENFFLTDVEQPQLSTWHACLRAQELVHTHSKETFYENR